MQLNHSSNSRSSMPLVVFDMDGTLLDTRLDIARAANEARIELGLPALSVTEIVKAVGDGVQLFVSRIAFPVEHPRFLEAKQVFLSKYSLNPATETKPYEGVEHVLRSLLNHGFKLAIVSNKPANLVDQLVRHFNWQAYFQTWLGGDSAKRPKPAGDLLLLALKQSGLRSSSPLAIVGDGHQDVMAAAEMKCSAYWCAWGFNEVQPQGYPSILLKKPEDLLEHLLGVHP